MAGESVQFTHAQAFTPMGLEGSYSPPAASAGSPEARTATTGHDLDRLPVAVRHPGEVGIGCRR